MKPQSPAVRKSGKVTVDDLVRAQKVVASMGSIERALAAIQALPGFRVGSSSTTRPGGGEAAHDVPDLVGTR